MFVLIRVVIGVEKGAVSLKHFLVLGHSNCAHVAARPRRNPELVVDAFFFFEVHIFVSDALQLLI